MSKKVDLDDLFREITNQHEEAYNPDDWQDMKGRLRALARTQASPWRKYSYRAALAVALILGLPAAHKLLDENRLSKTQATDNQIVNQFNNANLSANDKNPTILNLESNTNNSTNNFQNLPADQDGQSWVNKSGNSNPLQTIPKKSQYWAEFVENPDFLPYKENIEKSTSENPPNKTLGEAVAVLPSIGIADTQLEASGNLWQNASAQDFMSQKPSTAYPMRNWQVSLLPRYSTNKQYAPQMANRNSINVLVGKAAGLNGKEIAGIGNIETDYVKGAQIAGVFNTARQSVQGVQIAGVANLTGEKLQGAQIAGFVNFAGLKKANEKNYYPSQNLTKAKFSSQFSGLLNFDLHNTQDMQVSLVSNFAKKIDGIQAGGFLNVAEDVRGVQFSTGVNVAKRVRGVQIGLVNVADTVQGVPIGLLSIVRKNGYQTLEMWTSESFYYNFGYKIGVRKFYNIFALSSQLDGINSRWGIGYGFGTQINYTASSAVNIDLIGFHIGEKLRFTRELNLLTQLRLNLNKRLWNRNNVFVGPVLNTLFSDYRNADNSIGSRIAPWVLWQDNVGFTKIKMWVGFNFGLSF
ncbi:MAG: hypothetical protein MUE85_13455 [Microscillaceae bacterium]|jgi:hypothetical protein|nr:hypothetical protein [Microscillaceae bacterium]